MLISIHDKTLKRIAYLDNDKPETAHFYDDEWHRYLAEATSTFDFKVPKATAGDEVISALNEENYISFNYGGNDYLFNIMKAVENESTIEVSTENLNIELINEEEDKHDPQGAHPISWYLDQNGITSAAEIKLGYNEVADRSRTLSWDGTSTKLERLSSIVNGFDAEHEFVTHLNRDGTLKDITLNIYKEHDSTNQGVGTRRKDVTLYYGKNLKGVTRTVDKTNLYTGIRPLGNNDLTISSISKETRDEDGNLLFYTEAGSPYIFCPSMAERFPAQIQNSTGDKWIVLRSWSYDTDDVNKLYSEAIKKFKTVYQPAITYEVESDSMLDIGDTVTIHDSEFKPALILEARVSEQVISFSNPSKSKNTYSNFTALKNRTSTSINSRVAEIVKENQPYVGQILSDNGTTLSTPSESTTLTARVMRGKDDLTDACTILWYVDNSYKASGKSYKITAPSEETNEKYIVRFDAMDTTDNLLVSQSVTVSYLGASVQVFLSVGSYTFKGGLEGKALAGQSVKTKVLAEKSGESITATIKSLSAPSGVTCTSDGTTATISPNEGLTAPGVITFTITCAGKEYTRYFSYDIASGATQSDINTAVDNIQVGGRNYVRMKAAVDVIKQERYVKSATYDYNTNTWTINVTAGSRMASRGLFFANILLPYGQTACASMEVKPEYDCTFGYDINNRTQLATNVWNGNDNDNVSQRHISNLNLKANQWNKVWWTYSNTSDLNINKLDLYSYDTFGVVMTTQTKDQTYYIRNIKWEIGNKPTDWTPAPEDVQSGIDAARSTASNAQTAANKAQSAVDNIDNGGNNLLRNSSTLDFDDYSFTASSVSSGESPLQTVKGKTITSTTVGEPGKVQTAHGIETSETIETFFVDDGTDIKRATIPTVKQALKHMELDIDSDDDLILRIYE